MITMWKIKGIALVADTDATECRVVWDKLSGRYIVRIYDDWLGGTVVRTPDCCD